MKVGVFHVGPLTAGSHHIIRTIIEYCLTKGVSLQGIIWNHKKDDVEMKVLNKNTIHKWEFEQEVILNSIPLNKIKHQTNLIKLCEQLESIVVLGGNHDQFEFVKSNVLTVPISLVNDFQGSELTLGYDSALNVVVNNILKIQDTIESLKYGKLRVFCAQIPGHSYNSLLENAAIAVNGELVYRPSEMIWNKLINKLNDRYSRGNTYAMIVVNETIDPNEVHNRLSEKLDIDFNWNYIDEMQCIGPYPTAVDRLLAIKFAEKIIGWLDELGKTSKIVVKNNRIIVEESQK